MRRNREAIALVESWLEKDPAYDLETLPLLTKAVDANRTEFGARPLGAGLTSCATIGSNSEPLS
jgi:hypothetical protein